MLLSRDIIQVAWVVDDLEAAVDKWLKTTGIGPFFVIDHAPVEDALYRGKPAKLDFSGALAQAGSIQVELIQPHGDHPSAYRDSFAPGEEGFHHVCVRTDDLDADIRALAAMGCEVATQGRFGDMRFVYVDTRKQLGHMTEIIENKASINEMFQLVTDAAKDWDGKDPVRKLV